MLSVFFFFQAEDGIRDIGVTGVQTCALPISVQAMTGGGGWPMTVFLTPDGVPFYGGTYFPPEDRGGMPGFPRVLRAVAEAYRSQSEHVAHNAERMREMLARPVVPLEQGSLEVGMLDRAVAGLLKSID